MRSGKEPLVKLILEELQREIEADSCDFSSESSDADMDSCEDYCEYSDAEADEMELDEYWENEQVYAEELQSQSGDDLVDSEDYREADDSKVSTITEAVQPTSPKSSLKEAQAVELALDEIQKAQLERDNMRSQDANNKSKIASKTHRLEKQQTIAAYRAEHPSESSPMYLRHDFFQSRKESARNNKKIHLVKEELQLMDPQCDEELTDQCDSSIKLK